MIIAVDGPAASGKGTLARRLARHYGLTYLDTGLLYRALARKLLENDQDIHDPDIASKAAQTIDTAELVNDDALRQPGIGDAASIVAGHQKVREALLDYQRQIANTPPGAVLDGRDIGTVVCPNADVKLFVTATIEERAKRRYRELAATQDDISEEQVLQDITARDARDSSRAVAPLRPAENAHLLDTTNFDIETAYNAAVELIDAAVGNKGCAS